MFKDNLYILLMLGQYKNHVYVELRGGVKVIVFNTSVNTI